MKLTQIIKKAVLPLAFVGLSSLFSNSYGDMGIGDFPDPISPKIVEEYTTPTSTTNTKKKNSKRKYAARLKLGYNYIYQKNEINEYNNNSILLGLELGVRDEKEGSFGGLEFKLKTGKELEYFKAFLFGKSLDMTNSKIPKINLSAGIEYYEKDYFFEGIKLTNIQPDYLFNLAVKLNSNLKIHESDYKYSLGVNLGFSVTVNSEKKDKTYRFLDESGSLVKDIDISGDWFTGIKFNIGFNGGYRDFILFGDFQYTGNSIGTRDESFSNSESYSISSAQYNIIAGFKYELSNVIDYLYENNMITKIKAGVDYSMFVNTKEYEPVSDPSTKLEHEHIYVGPFVEVNLVKKSQHDSPYMYYLGLKMKYLKCLDDNGPTKDDEVFEIGISAGIIF